MANKNKNIKATVQSTFTTTTRTTTTRTIATTTTNKTMKIFMEKEEPKKFTSKQESFITASNRTTINNFSSGKINQLILPSSSSVSSSVSSSSPPLLSPALVNNNCFKKFTKDYSTTPKLSELPKTSNKIETQNHFTDKQKMLSGNREKYVSPYTGNVFEVYKKFEPSTIAASSIKPITKPPTVVRKSFFAERTLPPIIDKFPVKKIEINGNKKNEIKFPGICYILNHENFDSSEKDYRIGSDNDVKLLKNVFAEYNIKTTVFTNLTVKKLKTEIKKIENRDFSKHSCIIIVILSHGNRYETIKAKDGVYSVDDDILFPILKNKTLNTKPKFFIIQACKGNIDPRMYQTDSGQNSNVIPIGTASEILKCYSTFEGFVALRDSTGSIFIKEFCKLLHLYGRTKDIKEIMDITISEIKTLTDNKQIPSYCTTLTKSYIFGDYI